MVYILRFFFFKMQFVSIFKKIRPLGGEVFHTAVETVDTQREITKLIIFFFFGNFSISPQEGIHILSHRHYLCLAAAFLIDVVKSYEAWRNNSTHS